jgi:multiple sugar transport system substrate-binding protein
MKRLLACALGFLFIAGYCFATAQGEAAAPAAKKTLSLMVWNDEGWIRGHKELLTQYQQANPNITAELQIGDNQKFLVAVAGGAAPDLYFASYDWFQVYAADGTFLDVSSYAKADKQFKESDYVDKVLAAMKHRSGLYGLPQTFSPILAFYNKSLFDEAAVKYPSADWGWEELVDSARKLTRDKDGDGNMDQFGITHRTGYHRFPLWIWQAGGRMWNDDDPPRSTFDEPKAIEGLQFYSDLVRKYKVAPSLTEKAAGIAGVDATQMFGSARAAIDYTTRYYAPPEGMNWDVSRLWRGPGGRGSILIINYYAVTSKTRNPQDAWNLMRFLSYNHKVDLLKRTYRAIPAIKDEAAKLLTHPGEAPEHDMAFLEEIPNTRVLYYPSRIIKEFNETMNKNIELVLRGNMSAADAGKTMARDINDAIAKRGLR